MGPYHPKVNVGVAVGGATHMYWYTLHRLSALWMAGHGAIPSQGKYGRGSGCSLSYVLVYMYSTLPFCSVGGWSWEGKCGCGLSYVLVYSTLPFCSVGGWSWGFIGYHSKVNVGVAVGVAFQYTLV